MKRIVFVFVALALILTACASPTPIVITATPEPVQPTDVPPPTEAPPPTDVPAPTDEPAPTDTEAPAPTDTPEPEVPTDTPEPEGPAPTNTRPPAVGGDVFGDITRDIDAFSLKCSPSYVNFSLISLNKAITGVTIFYRVVPVGAVTPPQYIPGPEMTSDKKGNFTLELSALDMHPNMRAVAEGWFEYQFVGTNKFGDVVGRSQRFEDEVSYTLECP